MPMSTCISYISHPIWIRELCQVGSTIKLLITVRTIFFQIKLFVCITLVCAWFPGINISIHYFLQSIHALIVLLETLHLVNWMLIEMNFPFSISQRRINFILSQSIYISIRSIPWLIKWKYFNIAILLLSSAIHCISLHVALSYIKIYGK